MTRFDTKTEDHGEVPSILIGTPIIYSSSGALCGFETYNDCKVLGAVAIGIKEKTYFGSIIDKNKRISDKNMEFYPSFYVFQITPNRVPSQPRITAMFKDLKQGKEIANILSTITY
ncbi:hypothetical protein BH09PAT2_BH09PAT2_04730 [soil metagenome]